MWNWFLNIFRRKAVLLRQPTEEEMDRRWGAYQEDLTGVPENLIFDCDGIPWIPIRPNEPPIRIYIRHYRGCGCHVRNPEHPDIRRPYEQDYQVMFRNPHKDWVEEGF